MEKLKVLITSPSLNANENIGGISNLTRLLIGRNLSIDYFHFIVGKKESQKRNFKWVFLNIRLLIDFNIKLIRNKFDVVHINYPLSELSIIINFFLVLISNVYRRKTLIHLRGGVLSFKTNIKIYQKFLIKNSLRMSKKVIVLGNKEKIFINTFYKIHLDKILVLPNSVEIPPESNLAVKFKKKSGKDVRLNILFLGRIDKNKGLIEILKALEDIKHTQKFKFYLAGSGDDKDWFVEECTDLLNGNFIYLGVLDHIEKKDVFQDSDIFLLPSYFEGLPNALLEAMAFGVVPIVTRVGSIPEVVQDNVNGVFVEIKNSISLVERLNFIFNNRENLEKMAVESYKTIKDNFSIEEYIKSLNQIYSEL